MLVDPEKYAVQVNEFLGGVLETRDMASIVDANLYRQRK
jgi:hypothetical protein